MICTNPITITNNSNYVDLHSFAVRRSVPCGYCVACQRNKQIEYAIRGYYEYKECIDSGGFAYWDTLTFNSSHLPRFLGFPCFDKEVVQKYFKRLRRNLDRMFGVSQDALRYIVTCEYGSKHKRPHMHVVFFVRSNKINYRQFHQLLYQTWRNCNKRVISFTKRGKQRCHRDGSPIYKWVLDIRGNTDLRHAKDPKKGLLTSSAAISYVCKYVQKEDNYINELSSFINDELQSRGYPGVSPEQFKDHFQPWHLQSMGFGSYLEKCSDQKSLIDDLSCSIPIGFDGKVSISKKYPLPMYYLKRLYYEPVIESDGRLSMYKTKDYCDKLFNREKESHLNYIKSMTSQINNIDHLVGCLNNASDGVKSRLKIKIEDFKNLYKTSSDSLVASVYKCLGRCSVADFCTYTRYFRNWFQTDNYNLNYNSIIRDRIYGLGNISNPLRNSSKAKREYFSKVRIRNNLLYGHLEDLYNIICELNSAQTSFALQCEDEAREIKRNLKSLIFLENG